jgi:uncharacterized SAM-binding protein YcdF (DUF218 family)
MLRKFIVSIVIIFLLVILFFVFRIPVMKAAGNFLIIEDSLHRAEAIFILSGDPFDRGRQAKILYDEGYAPLLVTTGENVSHNLKALDIYYPEADLTKYYLINNGVDSTKIVTLRKGTSTIEESDVIINYAKENSLNKIIIVSSMFHTRRIHNFFHPKFDRENIQLIVKGAPSSLYNEQEWWKKEEGLIMVNNEYIKLVYYTIKY